MRKSVAILLLLLLLFNAMGFYGLFVGARYSAIQSLTQRLDRDDFSEEETVLIKVPLSIPYHLNDAQYERIDGEIEHQGEFLRLVKQKLVNDTLYIICVKDHQSRKIRQALGDYVKSFSDSSDAPTKGKLQITVIKDYIPAIFALTPSAKGCAYDISCGSFTQPMLHRSSDVVSPPPKA